MPVSPSPHLGLSLHATVPRLFGRCWELNSVPHTCVCGKHITKGAISLATKSDSEDHFFPSLLFPHFPFRPFHSFHILISHSLSPSPVPCSLPAPIPIPLPSLPSLPLSLSFIGASGCPHWPQTSIWCRIILNSCFYL